MRFLGLALAIIGVNLLLLTVILGLARQQAPTFAMIAYTTPLSGRNELWWMWVDGTHQHRLTNDFNHEYSPVWSPDGRQIAFLSANLREEVALYFIQINGQHRRLLLDQTGLENLAGWSPDGTWLLLEKRDDEQGQIDLFAFYLSSGELDNLTVGSGIERMADWSPDGTRLAFASTRSDSWDIFAMNTDGLNVQQFTDHSADDLLPVWSPDGTWLALTSAREGDYRIYRVPAVGGDLIPAFENQDQQMHVAWSPDSRYLVTTTRNGTLITAAADGTDNRVIKTEHFASTPTWSPDGEWIVFEGHSYHGTALYRVRPDGSGYQRLTSEAFGAVWSPPIDLPLASGWLVLSAVLLGAKLGWSLMTCVF